MSFDHILDLFMHFRLFRWFCYRENCRLFDADVSEQLSQRLLAWILVIHMLILSFFENSFRFVNIYSWTLFTSKFVHHISLNYYIALIYVPCVMINDRFLFNLSTSSYIRISEKLRNFSRVLFRKTNPSTLNNIALSKKVFFFNQTIC